MYAIIQTGGKQFKVQQGDVIYVEKLAQNAGETVNFDVLMLQQDNDKAKIGAPIVEGAQVEGKVLDHVKGQKIIVFKYKAKKNIRRKQGHRQPYTKVEITKVQA